MNRTVVPQDTRARLVEELDKLNVPAREHLDLTAWLVGLDAVPSLDALSVGERAVALERLINTRDTDLLLCEWRAARAMPETGGEVWLGQ